MPFGWNQILRVLSLHMYESEKQKTTTAVLMRVPTVPQPVLPCWQQRSMKLLGFFFAFCWGRAECFPFFAPFISYRRSFFLFFFTPPSKILQSICSRSISPVTSYLFTSVSVFILISPQRGAWEDGRRRGGVVAGSKRKRGQGLHFVTLFVLHLKGVLAGLIPTWGAPWRSAAPPRRLSNTAPFFLPRPLVRRDIQEERRGSSLPWKRVCVCTTVHTGSESGPAYVCWISEHFLPHVASFCDSPSLNAKFNTHCVSAFLSPTPLCPGLDALCGKWLLLRCFWVFLSLLLFKSFCLLEPLWGKKTRRHKEVYEASCRIRFNHRLFSREIKKCLTVKCL